MRIRTNTLYSFNSFCISLPCCFVLHFLERNLFKTTQLENVIICTYLLIFTLMHTFSKYHVVTHANEGFTTNIANLIFQCFYVCNLFICSRIYVEYQVATNFCKTSMLNLNGHMIVITCWNICYKNLTCLFSSRSNAHFHRMCSCS